MWGDNGRQKETRPWDVGHTVQHRHTCGETMGNNETQPETTGDGETRRETMGGNWADNGRQWKTSGDKTLGKRTNHLTQAHM